MLARTPSMRSNDTRGDLIQLPPLFLGQAPFFSGQPLLVSTLLLSQALVFGGLPLLLLHRPTLLCLLVRRTDAIACAYAHA